MIADMELGLRERKRRETRRALQLAILEQSIERGYDRVTIEEICRAADVSPRTFFNYFASKEDAVLGAVPGFPDAEVVERYVDEGFGADALRDLPVLFLSMSDALDDIEILGLRKQLMRREPGLLGLRVSSSRAFENLLADVVLRRLNRDEPSVDRDARERRARLIAMVGFATMRFGWLAWIDEGGVRPLDDQLRASFDELELAVAPRSAAAPVIG
jgi:AcrR family transcriptional regulator